MSGRFDTDGEGWIEQFNSFEAAQALWEHNMNASIKGKRGQKVLRELEAALLALPTRRLIHGALATREGDVCAIGALAKAKGLLPEFLPSRADWEGMGPNEDYEQTMEVGKRCGLTQTLAWVIGSLGDVDYGHMGEEQRYHAVLGWVRERLKEPSDVRP